MYRLRDGGAFEEAGQQIKVQARQGLPGIDGEMPLAAQSVGLDAASAPAPNLGDAELAVDLKLFDAA